MNIQQLRYFLYIAQYKNFTKAAEHFYIGQPALSRQIFNLEKELGANLFIRNNRSVELTEAGKVLQEEGEQLICRINLITEKTQMANKGSFGSLNILSLGRFGGFIPSLIKKFRTKYPKVKLQVEGFTIPEMNNAILYGNYDIGISLDYCVPKNDILEAIFLGKEQFCVLSCQDSLISQKKTITVNDLLEENLLLYDYISPRFLKELPHDNYCFDDNMKLEHKITYSQSIDSLLLQVSSGLGITVVPTFVISNIPDSQSYVIQYLSDTDMEEDIVLFWNKSNHNPIIKNFIDMIKLI